MELTLKILGTSIKLTVIRDKMSIVLIENLDNRMKSFLIENIHLLQGKDAMESLFNTLKSTPQFTEFGVDKIRMTRGIIVDPKGEYAYHQNTLINNSRTFEEFRAEVGPYIQEKYLSGSQSYSQTVVNRFKVLVWDASDLKNKHIKISKIAMSNSSVTIDISDREVSNTTVVKNKTIKGTRSLHTVVSTAVGKTTTKTKVNKISKFKIVNKNKKNNKKNFDRFIKPLAKKLVSKLDKYKIEGMLNRFSTMDLETMDYKGNQVPIAISLSMVSPKKSTKEHFFTIDHSKLVYLEVVVTQESLDMVIDQMWIDFINFIKIHKNPSLKVIFVHNLGSFEGIFIFKYLTKLCKDASFETLIDGSNDFIKIGITLSKGLKINWIDSCRIFPIGLDKLC